MIDLRVYTQCPKCDVALQRRGGTEDDKAAGLSLRGVGRFPSMWCPKCERKWNSTEWVEALKLHYGDALYEEEKAPE